MPEKATSDSIIEIRSKADVFQKEGIEKSPAADQGIATPLVRKEEIAEVEGNLQAVAQEAEDEAIIMDTEMAVAMMPLVHGARTTYLRCEHVRIHYTAECR